MKTIPSTILRSLRMAGLFGAAAALVPTSTQAVVLSLDPAAQTIDIGQTASVNLNISGLDDVNPVSLGAWLTWISFNNSIVSITAGDVTFGTGLDAGVWGSLQYVETGPGVVKADEVSFEDPADLNATQLSSFTLATFTFLGLAPGTTLLTLTGPLQVPQLSDENGFSILDFEVSNAEITVRGGQQGVPDAHATGLSLMLGLGLLAFVRRLRA